MIHILVVTHGMMAEGIVQTAKMFTGEQENLNYISLEEGMGQEELTALINEEMKGIPEREQLLIFCDILGGTPFNVSSRLAFENENISIFYGVNLPILVSAILSRDGQSLLDLTSLLVESSNESLGLSTL
ncbi:PTS sugar transporter subunit IIA [Bacillus sp. FJAT-50079]|uniref:PTS sugar transporter subunit IIA n=1 Tax=Bacillus sp. FJAT-50079 TaxID=2833577 RepID=UPI001BC8CC4B|nr:PTS sugar transporter subunit IIA [Bacillus sp. FJAT-50079]MBS4210149.1 PTS sugar transporter subunit IIA [Bacillus sp. FJAT-50079]